MNLVRTTPYIVAITTYARQNLDLQHQNDTCPSLSLLSHNNNTNAATDLY
jgi:hypothetical protein